MPSFSLNSLLSPRLDPSSGAEAIRGFANYELQKTQLGEQMRANQANEQEANRSHLANEALGQGQLQLGRDRFSQERSQSQFGVLEKYNQLLNAGDYAGAEQLAPAMQRMGIHLQALDQHADAPSHQEWAQSQQAPEAPAQQAEIPQQAGPAPAPFLQEYMAGKGGAEERAEPMDNQAEEAAERVRSIGGDASGIQGPPQELPQSRFSLPQQPQATGPLPVYRVIIDGQDRGVIDPNKRAAQERAYVENEAKASLGGMPERFRPTLGGFFEGVHDRAGLEKRQDMAQNTENQLFAGERAQESAAAMGARAGQMDHRNALRRIDSLVKQEFDKTQTERQALAKLASTLELMKTSPLGQRISMAQTAKALFGAAASDREGALILQGDGKFTDLERRINEWVAGGALPENFVADLADANQVIGGASDRLVRARGKMVADLIRNDPDINYEMDPADVNQYAANGYSRITGADVSQLTSRGQRRPTNSASVNSATKTKGANPITGEPTPAAQPPKKFTNAPDL